MTASDPRARLTDAFPQLARRGWGMARSLLPSAEDAQDAVGNAFLTCARKVDTLPRGDLWPWFSSILYYEVRNMRRRRRPASGLDPDAILTNSDGVDSDLIDTETRQRLLTELANLKEGERDAIVLTRFSGYTVKNAAKLLEINEKTCSSRLHRGISILRQRLCADDGRLNRALHLGPLAMPVAGWASLTNLLKAEMVSALSLTGHAGTALGTVGVLTMKNLIVTAAIGLIAGVGVGYASHELLDESSGATSISSESEESKADSTAGKGGTGSLDRRQGASGAAVDSLEQERNEWQLRAADLEAQLEAARIQSASFKPDTNGQATFTTEDYRELQQAYDALLAETADYRAKTAAAKPVFTFGEVGKLGAVRDSDWSALAESSMTVAAAIAELDLAKREGRAPAEGTQIRLQQHTERMRTFEYAAKEQQFPTWAEQNGELTHPVILANLFGKSLDQAGLPLNEAQVSSIVNAGETYDREWGHLQKSYGSQTLRAQKMLDEYTAKGRFLDRLYALLTPDQRNKVVNPETFRRARLDLMCPTLMVIHTSPVITGKNVAEIKEKLLERLGTAKQGRGYFDSFGRYGFSSEELKEIAPLIDQWGTDVGRITQPVPQASVANYTYDEARLAGEATVRLFQRILESVVNNESERQELLNAPTFLIPRVIQE